MSRKLPGSAIVANSITLSQISGSVNDTSNAAYGQANSARDQANTGRTQANTAYDQANNARNQANTGYGQANTAYDQANTARTQANTAYGQANAAYGQANAAYGQANAAYGAANTRLSASGGTLSGDLIITGNLTVSGNSTTLNTEVLTVEDAEVILLSNVASTPALNAGIIVNRGTSTNTFLRWNETLDEWGWSDNGTTTYYFDDLRAGLATTNTTFGTINTSLGTINTSYQAAYAQANTAGTNALNAYGQANAAYGAANNRVLKAGDTMTGQLNISAGGLLVTGNVGIGTTSPAYKLDVNGNTRIKGVGSYLYFDTTSSDASAWIRVRDDYILSLWNNRGSRSELRLGNEHVQFFTNNDTEQMRITSGGNVGIGTTSPQSKLEVATSSNNFSHFGATSTANGQFTGITLGYRENNSSYRKAAIVQEQIGDNSARGHLHLLVDIANDEGSVVLGDSKLMIHGTTGNVGIGTTSPGAKLQVESGEVRITSAGAINTHLNYQNGGDNYISHGNAGATYFRNSSATLMTILGSGYVGIGTTNPPRRLSINALGTGNYEMVVGWSGSSLSQNATLDVITTHDSYGFQVWDDNNLTTPRFLVARGGNVGIGTQTPLAKLDVVGDTYVRSGTFFTDTIRPYSGQQLTVLNGGSNSLYINGKVGIGTSTPAYKQDVEGISYNRGEIIRPSVYGGDNSGTNSIIGSYILGAGKYWTVTSGAKYVHILLPARYNANNGASLMWCIEVKGYDFNAARIINLMIGGYVTPVSNGGPMSQVAVWDSAGSGVYSPTAYFSSNYNRGVARFYLSSAYYASFTINTIASGNGDVIAPDELTIIESVNATI